MGSQKRVNINCPICGENATKIMCLEADIIDFQICHENNI